MSQASSLVCVPTNWLGVIFVLVRRCWTFVSEAKRISVKLNRQLLDADALKIVRRLKQHGFEAYLVGGCVRDLILGEEPKDFDVVTSAWPNQIRKLFRNCRIIGRRFRLAHIFFAGGKIIEVATFRATQDKTDGDGLMIRDDNVFGTAKTDALRRDFTLNALFYDLSLIHISEPTRPY